MTLAINQIKETIEYYWESSNDSNTAFIVLCVDLDHPLTGQYPSTESVIKAGKKAGYDVTLVEI